VTDEAAPGRQLRAGEIVAYATPQIGINLMGALVGQWLTYLYVPPDGSGRTALIGAGVFATVMLIGRIVDGVADPLVGYASDRTRTRWGRRMPWILGGTPLLALSYAAMWWPPDADPTPRNALWLGAALVVYWIAFTVVIGPYSALLPEIAQNTRDRVKLSSYMALFTVGGVVLGLGVGPLQSRFPDGFTLAGITFSTGLQGGAVAATVVIALTMIATPLGIRESPHAENKEVPAGLFRGLWLAAKNPAFLAFLGLSVLVQLGAQVFGVSLPYLCTQVLERDPGAAGIVASGQGEAWASKLQIILFATSLLAIPAVNVVVRRTGKKRLMLFATSTFAAVLCLVPYVTLFPDPALPMIVACVLMGVPVSCVLVVVNAVWADVVDYDEQRTGVRREGIYAGASAFIAKSALGLAQFIVVGALTFGSSREDPTGILMLGPIAGALIAAGTLLYSRSPIR